MKLFAEITKSQENDDGTITVGGYASSEVVDSAGEVIKADAIRDALPDFFKYGSGPLREMHQNIAAGAVEKAEVQADGRTYIEAIVVDPASVKKVQAGVLKGFSVGGKCLGRDTAEPHVITKMRLTEISLVDRPCNPEAVISMYKAEDMNEETKPIAAEPEQFLTKENLIKMLNDPEILGLLKREVTDNGDAMPDGGSPKEAEKAENPSELRKSVRALGVKADADDIKKGLYQVSELANFIQSLVWLQESCEREAEMEGDNSPIPGQLLTAVGTLGDLLMAMVKEEIGELVTAGGDNDAIATLSSEIELCAANAGLQKFAPLIEIAKAGARNSAADQSKLQAAHDLLVELGTTCATDGLSTGDPQVEVLRSEGADMEKNEHFHDEGRIAKALGQVEKMAGELGALRKSLVERDDKLAELQKRFDEIPQAPKGKLLAIGKSEEVSPLGDEPSIKPILKNDGTIDDVATEIKKVFAGGGKRII
jgi:hypothetical protein